MGPVAPGLSLAPARVHPDSADETALGAVIRTAAVLSAAVVALQAATFIARAARAVALVHPFAADRKTAWDHAGAHRVTSVVATAGDAQTRGATLSVQAVHARDPCRVLAPARALVLVRIRRTRVIAGAGAALGRVAGAEGV